MRARHVWAAAAVAAVLVGAGIAVNMVDDTGSPREELAEVPAAGTPAPGANGPVGASGRAGLQARPPSASVPARASRSAAASAPGIAAAPATLASSLHILPSNTTQVVIVHSDGWGTSYATLETFAKVDGAWRAVFGPMAARIGSKGFADTHAEGVASTPTGVYAFDGTMYGLLANPGVGYTYHRIVTDDWWNENPDSPGYNTFVHSAANPGGASEALWQVSPQYNHFAVIRYNMPATGTARGSGIFLHVSGTGATAGCVSVSQANLVKVLTWLNRGANPRIVMAPSSVLGRY